MNVLGRVAQGVFGKPSGSGQEEDDTELERLLHEISDSRHAEDRRDAMSQLANLLRGNQAAQRGVGIMGLPVLLAVLQEDRDDIELLKGALEVLQLAVALPGGHCSTGQLQHRQGEPFPALINADQYCHSPDNVLLLLGLLRDEESAAGDFYVKYGALQALAGLLAACPDKLQACVLSSNIGVLGLMELLSSPMEVLRNEALLLLVGLCNDCPQLASIVAFEGAFDKLLAICAAEGGLEAGNVVVQDAAELLNNLLRDNLPNQRLFRAWPAAQDLAAAKCCQEDQNRRANQQKLGQLGIGLQLTRLAVDGGGAPSPSVRAQALLCLGDLVNGHPQLQEQLAGTMVQLPRAQQAVLQQAPARSPAAAAPPVPLLQVVVQLALHAPDVLERAAAVHVLQSFCLDNSLGQLALLTSVNPSSDPHSVGGQLLGALLCHQPPGTSLPSRPGQQPGPTQLPAALLSPLELQLTAGRAAAILGYLLKDNAPGQTGLLGLQLSDAAGDTLLPSHLPLLVDLAGGRVAAWDVHTAGLAAVLLGVCLMFAPGSPFLLNQPQQDVAAAAAAAASVPLLPGQVKFQQLLDIVLNRIGLRGAGGLTEAESRVAAQLRVSRAEMELGTVRQQLSAMQGRWSALEAEAAAARGAAEEARATAAKAEADLAALSTAYNGLEAHAFEVEEQLRKLQQRNAADGPAVAADKGIIPEAAVQARIQAAVEQDRQQRYDAVGSAVGGLTDAAFDTRLAAAVAEARAAAEAEAGEEMEDLLACLGEEQAKVEVLSARLSELGEDVEILLTGVAGDAAGDSEDPALHPHLDAKVDELL
eukprot:gene6091-6329_t